MTNELRYIMPVWPPGDNSKFTIIIISVRLILTALSFALFAISARVWGFGGEAFTACLLRAAAATAAAASVDEDEEAFLIKS